MTIKGEKMLFENLDIIRPIQKALKDEGYSSPTPIQEKAIPPILEGRDLLGCAQTGTGKTAAFALPVLQNIFKDKDNNKGVKGPRIISAVVLAPTRELAIQIGESFKAYSCYMNMKNTVIFGGVPQGPQVRALKDGVDVLVATPGRLLDLINQEVVDLSEVKYFVLDEADRMLDMGMIIDVKKIIAKQRDKSAIELIRESDIGLISQSGVRRFIEEYVDLKVIKESKKTLYACAYNIDLKNTEYFRLNEFEEDEIIDIALASCAIPFIFKPIKINEYRYADGGINNPKYSCQNADNVPINPLKNHHCDVIIVVHLSYKQPIDKSGFEDTHIIEIYPSIPLETINGIGTVNLMASTLNQHVELGYRDALTVLAPMIIDMLKGKPLDKLIKKHEEYNKQFKRL